MRKLKLQVQTSIDGFICGPNGEMDWVNMNWGSDIMAYVQSLTDPVDTILLGKNLAMGFIPHWSALYADPKTRDAASEKFVLTPKVVFSKTLTKSEWEHTVVNNGELATEVNKLKQGQGNDMIAYGGAKFVASLIKENLIDELHLFVNPTAIGKGMPIFNELTTNQSYTLINSRSFDCGIAVLVYKPLK